MPDHHDELPNEFDLEAPQVDNSSRLPAEALPPSPTRRSAGPKPGKLPPWKVVLYRDQVNGMQEVVLTIKKLTPLSDQAAVRRMLEAHQRGRAMLLTTHRERAELYKYQFLSRGLTVTIGPV